MFKRNRKQWCEEGIDKDHWDSQNALNIGWFSDIQSRSLNFSVPMIKSAADAIHPLEGVVGDLQQEERSLKEAQFEKGDGTQFHPPIHISNLVITKFTKEKKMDPWRANMIERKAIYGFYEEELKAPKKEKEEEK